MQNPKLLVSLAILQTDLRQQRKDPLDYFVPFVKESLKLLDRDEVSLPQVKQQLLSEFGLDIPSPVIRTILNKLRRSGFLKPDQGIFKVNREKFQKSGKKFRKLRIDFEREYRSLVTKFAEYVKTRHKDFEFTEEMADRLLFQYIETKGARILKAIFEEKDFDLEAVAPLRGKYAYYLATFIKELLENDPNGVSYLEKIIKGNMLYSALFSGEFANISSPRFSNLTIYLDTPVVLKILGYKGHVSEEYGNQLLHLLRQEKARLKIFTYTLREIERILVAAEYVLSGGEDVHLYGDVVRTLIEKGYTPEMVRRDLDMLENRIEKKGIEIVSSPPFQEDLVIDERRLSKILQREVGYRHDEALQHDIDCLSAIYRLRKGEITYSIERSEAIFLTDNNRLVAGSKKFFRKSGIPLCILDHVMATLAWIKQPLKAPDLPKIQVMADCYIALNPTDELWLMYLSKLEELKKEEKISEEEYYILKYSAQAKSALMEVTKGETSAFVEGTIQQVLQKATESLLEKERAKVRIERQKRKMEEEKRIQAEKEVVKAREDVQRVKFDAMRRETIIRQRLSNLFAKGIIIILFVILLVSSCLSYAYKSLWGIGATVFLLVINILGWVFEISGKKITQLISKWIVERIIEAGNKQELT